MKIELTLFEPIVIDVQYGAAMGTISIGDPTKFEGVLLCSDAKMIAKALAALWPTEISVVT